MKLLFKINNGTTIGHSDFKQHYNGLNRSLEFDEIQPSIRQATNIYIIPYIGLPLYSIIANYFDDGTQSNAYKNTLLEYLKDAVASYAVHHALGEKIAILASAGVRTGNDEKSTNAPQWAFNKKEWKALINGDKFLDIALRYIEQNKTQFTEWLPNESGTTLFNNSTVLEKYLNVSGFRAFSTMSKYLRKSTEDNLIPILGKTQFNNINNTNTNIKDEFLNLCRKYVAETAFYKAIPNLTLITDAEGLRIVSKTDSFDSRESLKNAQHLEMIKILMTQTEQNANDYRRQLLEFLYDNKDTLTDWQESNFYKTTVAISTDSPTVRANDFGAVSIG